MQTKEKLTKILDESIFRMEITDPTIVWFSERLEWLVNRLMTEGVVIPGEAEWLPHGDSKGWKDGYRYTHYCSHCGQYGFKSFEHCPHCLSRMGIAKEEPILEKEMSL